ncbi:ASPIC/UnbV domain-containing protein, partial [candidate division KSB1 bacterium]|nr:ASPIC/UnbV domain-containing protein [candidate division KSB1 bacterium]
QVSGYSIVPGDIDNDGDQDLLVLRNADKDPAARPKLYLNNGKGEFISAGTVGVEVPAKDVRGGACADVDQDGDLDYYIVCAKGPSFLLRNDQKMNHHYLRVSCWGPKGDRGGLGTKVTLYKPGFLGDSAHILCYQEVGTIYGYMSQNEPVLHFGLGLNAACDMRVVFVDGQSRDYHNVFADQTVIVKPEYLQHVTLALWDGDGQTGIVDQPLPDSIRVRAVDQSDQPVVGYQASLTVLQGGGKVNGASNATVFTRSNGVAAFQWTLGAWAGLQRLQVSSSDTSFQVQAQALPDVPEAMEKLGGDDQTLMPGVEFSQPYSLQVVDQFDNPVPLITVEFEVTEGEGHLRGASAQQVQTDSSGTAQVYWTPGPYLGPPNRLEARAFHDGNPLSGSPLVWYYPSKAIDPLTSTIAAISPVPADGLHESLITVRLKNMQQQAAGSGYTVLLQVSGSENTLAVADTLTDAEGKVTARLSSTKAEKKIIEAMVKGLDIKLVNSADVVFQPLDVTADSLVLVDGDRQSGVVDQPLVRPFKVQVLSDLKSPLPDYDVRFLVTAGGGKINGRDTLWTKTNANGEAQCFLQLGKVAGVLNQAVQVWAAGARNAPLMFRATAMADVAAQLVKVSGDSQMVVKDKTTLEPFIVGVHDQFNNPVYQALVQFTALSGGQMVTPQPVMTDSSGQAAATAEVPLISGAYIFEALVDGLQPVQFTVTVFINHPPKINSYVPAEKNIKGGYETAIDFAITEVLDEDGDSLCYHWLVNNQFAGTGSNLTLQPNPLLGKEIDVCCLVFDTWDTVSVSWTVSVLMTDAEQGGGQILPQEWQLHPNYPNPFNPATTIRVDAPAPQNVELAIYDINGKQIRVLFQGMISAGRHVFTWDGRDEAGGRQSSGIYICVYKGSNFRQSKRLALIK